MHTLITKVNKKTTDTFNRQILLTYRSFVAVAERLAAAAEDGVDGCIPVAEDPAAGTAAASS